MNPTAPDDTEDEQHSTETTQTPMQAPEAASKRDVEEAEVKADEAIGMAAEAQEVAVQEAEQVHSELREEIEELEKQVEMLDRLVNKVYEIGQTCKGEPELNPDMPNVVPANREPENQDKSIEEVFTNDE